MILSHIYAYTQNGRLVTTVVHCCSLGRCCSWSLVSAFAWYVAAARYAAAHPFNPYFPGVLLKAAWVPGQGCVITGTNNQLLAITFIYTMAFDFTVLSLTAYKLYFGSTARSRLVTLIFNDGLIYFAIAYVLCAHMS